MNNMAANISSPKRKEKRIVLPDFLIYAFMSQKMSLLRMTAISVLNYSLGSGNYESTNIILNSLFIIHDLSLEK